MSIDLRPWLPRVPENDPQPQHQTKDSWTVHYQGSDVPRDLSDADAQLLIGADAREHIDRDWNDEYPGTQGGGGVMYAYMIAPSGTVYQTRDEDSWLWHCGNEVGNKASVAIQVMCGPDTPPTPSQLDSLARLIATEPTWPVYPHKKWSPTQCPGSVLAAWTENPQEVDVTQDEFNRMADEWWKNHLDGDAFVETVIRQQASDAHHHHDVSLSGVPTSEPK